jgi:hypothetical protein
VKDKSAMIMAQFEDTPKALANFSPGLERSDNPGCIDKKQENPERVCCLPNPFRVELNLGN